MTRSNHIRIRNGMDIPLAGAPRSEVAEPKPSGLVSVYPGDIEGIKPRLLVKEGDAVRRGSALFQNKKNESQKFCAPAGGVVKAIVMASGASSRRSSSGVAKQEPIEYFRSTRPIKLSSVSRDEVLNRLLDTGYLALIANGPSRSRPTRPPRRNPSSSTHEHRSVPGRSCVAIKGHETAFQAGLNALSR